MAELDAAAIAEKYLTAVDQFCEAAQSVAQDQLDFRPDGKSWSAREVAFHAAEVDQNLGIRLRRLLTEEKAVLAGVHLPAWVALLRNSRLDVALALDALRASSAINVAIIESLDAVRLRRAGTHSEGHEVTVHGLCTYMALHLESHVKQLGRIAQARRAKGA
jgi:hypothetical protein